MSSEQLGPAWTRETKKKGKRTQQQQQQPFYSATGSNSASSSSLLQQQPPPISPSTSPVPQQEAPYLTHVVRNPLGQLTLVPPDNLGRQRHSGDPDGHQPPQPPPTVKKKTKKKKKLQRSDGQPDTAILDAVINAGRSPGTPPTVQGRAPSPAVAPQAMARGVSSPSGQQQQTARSAAAQAAQARQDTVAAASTDTATAAPGYPFPSPSPTTAPAPPFSSQPAPESELDSHHTLASTSILDSPPPAYPAPPSPEPPLLDLSSPNPLPLVQPPSPTPMLPQLAISPDENFVYDDQDPFVLAWEADRASGLALDVRIERDLARRRAAAGQDDEGAAEADAEADLEGVEDAPVEATPPHVDSTPGSAEQPVSPSTPLASTSSPASPLAVTPAAVPPPSPPSAPPLESEDVLASWQRREIAEAELSQDAPRVARALSVYAGRRFAEAAERRIARAQRRRGTGVSVSTSTSEGVEEEEERTPTHGGRPPVPVIREALIQTPSATTVASHADGAVEAPSKGAKVVDAAQEAEEANTEEVEGEEEEEEEEDETPAARAVPVDAHRRFAEAAERRMAAERAARARELERQASSSAEQHKDVEADVEAEVRPHDVAPEELAEEYTPSSTYALLFPPKPFGSLVKPISNATSASISTPAPLPPTSPSPPPAAAPSPQPSPRPAPVREPSPVPPVPQPPQVLRPRSPPPPPAPVPASAFSDLASAVPPSADRPNLASSMRPLPRPRPPTINELLASSPTRAEAPRPPPPPPPAPRRPPPVPPSRPSSLYNHDLPLVPPLASSSYSHAPPSSAAGPAPLLTHIPTGDRSSLPAPLQPLAGRPPPPRPPSFNQQQRRPAPPPPPPPSSARLDRPSFPSRATPNLPPGAGPSAFGPSGLASSQQPQPSGPPPPPPVTGTFTRPAPPPPPPPAQQAQRRRPLPVPPSPPPAGSSSSSSSAHTAQARVDAYTALRARVEAFNVARERERALAALEGNSPRTSIEVVEREREGMVTSESSNSLAVVGERPRSATSSFEVPEVEEAAQVATAAQTRAQAQEFAQYTDLDLLLARLEGDQVVGTNFEDLNLLGEVMGPAQSPGASLEELETLAVARVELERRRIDKHGKVKQKLSVVGVRCIDCSICLTRFRVDDLAVVLPLCFHAFHEKCIRSWLNQSRQCPLCRAEVFPPRPERVVDV